MMWRQVAITSPYYAQQTSPQQHEEILEVHGHSPRHLAPSFKPPFPPAISFMPQTHPSIFPRQVNSDPFVDTRGAAFSGWRQVSSDVSMPDYASSSSNHTASRNVSDPMQISEKGERGFQSLQMAGAYDQLCEALIPSAPANTPRNAATPVIPPVTHISSVRSEPGMRKSPILLPSLAKLSLVIKGKPDESGKTALLKQAVSDSIQSEEIISGPQAETELTSLVNENINPIVSQSITAPASNHSTTGTKRPRVVTPASVKVIDDEDEPRGSPVMRKVSRASTRGDGKENHPERRVLSGIENV
jgi:hypothetical protein